MILYHISTNLSHDGYFFSQVPECQKYRLDNAMEDNEADRVCVASTIEGCFSSLPGGGANIQKLIEQQKGLFKLFVIDTKKLGFTDDEIVDGNSLFEDGLVYDSHLTGEHWIYESFEVPVEDTFFIYPYSWETEEIPYDSKVFMEKRGEFETIFNPKKVTLIKNMLFLVDDGYDHPDIYAGKELQMSLLENPALKEVVNRQNAFLDRIYRRGRKGSFKEIVK